jgi:hypothetical protein
MTSHDIADALAALDAALRAELGLPPDCLPGTLPPPAEGWRLLLTLAFVALRTDCASDTLARSWRQSTEEIDRALAPFAALGLVEEGRYGPLPTAAGFAAVVEQLVAAGRLVPPVAARISRCPASTMVMDRHEADA